MAQPKQKPTVVVLAQAPQAQEPKRNKNKGKKKVSHKNNPGDGTVVVSRLELLASITATNGTSQTSGTLPISPASCVWLKTLASSFERYRWESVQIFWRGATGTTFGGLIAFGVDWTGRAKLSGFELDRSKVLGLTPLCDVPVWTDSTNKPLVLPRSDLSTRSWYGLGEVDDMDSGPGNLVYSAYHDQVTSGKFLGEFWIRYKARLQGTTQA